MAHGFVGESLEWQPIEDFDADLIALPCLVDLFFPSTQNASSHDLIQQGIFTLMATPTAIKESFGVKNFVMNANGDYCHEETCIRMFNENECELESALGFIPLVRAHLWKQKKGIPVSFGSVGALWSCLNYWTNELESEHALSLDALTQLLYSVTLLPSKSVRGIPSSVLHAHGQNPNAILIKRRQNWGHSPLSILKNIFLTGPSCITAVIMEGQVQYSTDYYQHFKSIKTEFDTVESAIQDIQKGNFVIVVDDEDRENEGDLVIAAEHMTEEKMAFMVRYTSGVICVPMTPERADELELPLMVKNTTDVLKTAYTITVDYAHGTSTGISAHDRALTVRQLSGNANAKDFNRPGHVFPLRYTPGGVLKRMGHTEASVDLCLLAGCSPTAAISEIVLDNGKMARRDDLFSLASSWNMKMITIADLKEYKKRF